MKKQPWAVLIGFLMASIVTLIGIFRDLEPEVILVRAGGSGLACGIVVVIARFVWNRMGQVS
ncbi:MAG: hypothetical protein HY040_10420 [Planctomycetes bacterium]|nr:hypothetical protein [Planctomycetota bacterium]